MYVLSLVNRLPSKRLLGLIIIACQWTLDASDNLMSKFAKRDVARRSADLFWFASRYAVDVHVYFRRQSGKWFGPVDCAADGCSITYSCPACFVILHSPIPLHVFMEF